MTRSRQEFIQRRIDFTLQRQRHMRERAPDCDCPLCLKDGEVLAIIMARIEANARQIGEPPF
jgi:hypothetical protein